MKKAILLLSAVILLGPAWNVRAVDFEVEDASGLQTALNTAGLNNEDDTIKVKEGIYSTADNGDSPFTYQDGADKSLTIIGEGAGTTILTGNGATRILEIDTTTSTDDAGAVITIRKLSFKSGYAATQSAGLYIQTVDADLVMSKCVVFDNHGDHIGGLSADIDGSGSFLLKDSEFTGNTAGPSGRSGADIHTVSGPIHVEDCTFTGNTGGLYAALIVHSDMAAVSVLNSTFTGNQGKIGGGIAAGSGQNLVNLAFNTVIDNDADFQGGGVYAWSYSGVITLASNIIALNRSLLDGGGVWADLGTTGPSQDWALNVTGNTIWGNQADMNAGGLRLGISGNDATGNIYNNIVRGNTAGMSYPDIYVNNDGDNDGTGAAVNLYNNDNTTFFARDGDNLNTGSNFDVDPLFVDTTAWNFKLKKGSQCIDKGDNSAPGLALADFQGDYRILDGDGVKPAVTDIGADEKRQGFKKVKVLNPNGGETITGGSDRMVFWGAPKKARKFKLLYSLNGGRKWKKMAKKVKGVSYTWSVPGVGKTKDKCLFKVIAYDKSGSVVGRDTSNKKFTMEPEP